MNSTYLNRVSQLIAGCVLATIGSSATAVSTWNFSSCNGNAGNQTLPAGSFGNSWNCAGSVSGNNVTVSSWGGFDSSGTGGFQKAFTSNQGGSGFGIASQSETLAIGPPNHAADNNSAVSTPDMFVLKFNTAVALDTVTLGWNQNDTDFTLMAYKGAVNLSNPLVAGTGIQTKTALNTGTGLTTGGAGSGWALVQQVGTASPTGVNTGGSSTDITRTVNNIGSPVVSSWWLISAYREGYNGSSALDSTKDYFKLFSVVSKDVNTPGTGVPEPGSLALMGAALAGMLVIRRRKEQAASAH